MALIRIPYQLHDHGLLPLCELVLLGKARRVPVRAVVDTGATHPYFLQSHAEDAGMDLSRARPLRVIFGGSETEGRLLDVYIEIVGHRLRIEACFVEDIRLGYALLGRGTVFNQFNEVAFLERGRSPRVEFRG